MNRPQKGDMVHCGKVTFQVERNDGPPGDEVRAVWVRGSCRDTIAIFTLRWMTPNDDGSWNANSYSLP